MTGLTDRASRNTTYTYLDDGSLKDVTYPNGTKGTYAYDNALRLTEIHHQTTGGSPSTITRHKYTLDKVGNRTQLDEVLAEIGAVTGGLITPGAQPGSFAPPAAQSTTIAWTGTPVPQYTATIKNAGGTTVRTLTNTLPSATVTWDGKDTAGAIQPPGTYTVTLTASGQADQTVTIILTRQASATYTYDNLYRLTQATNPWATST